MTSPSSLIQSVIRGPDVALWMTAPEAYDEAVYRHSLLVAEITGAFTTTLDLEPVDQHLLVKAALLHDAGKLKVPLSILNKPGRLEEDEMAMVRSHAELGYRMLAAYGGYTAELLDVVLHHHEKLDGSGYPNGLQSMAISTSVRTITLCDMYAALIEPRVYCPGLSSQETLQVMVDMGDQLDESLFAIFRVLAPRWRNLTVHRSGL